MTGLTKAELNEMVAEAMEGVTHTSHGIVADRVRGEHQQAIRILDLSLSEPPPVGG